VLEDVVLLAPGLDAFRSLTSVPPFEFSKALVQPSSSGKQWGVYVCHHYETS
jgi:hypothetical protein